MNIGEAAELSNLPAKTIRYYEEVALVVPGRKSNGYRDYDAESVHKLRFVQRARGLGFSLDECRILLSLYEDKSRSSSDVRSLAKARLEMVEKKLEEMHSLKRTLEHLVDHCSGDDMPDCPILDELAGQ